MALGTFSPSPPPPASFSPQHRGLVPESRPHRPFPSPVDSPVVGISEKGNHHVGPWCRGFLSAEGFQVHAARKCSVLTAGPPGEGGAAGRSPAGCPHRGVTGRAAPASSRPLTGRPSVRSRRGHCTFGGAPRCESGQTPPRSRGGTAPPPARASQRPPRPGTPVRPVWTPGFRHGTGWEPLGAAATDGHDEGDFGVILVQVWGLDVWTGVSRAESCWREGWGRCGHSAVSPARWLPSSHRGPCPGAEPLPARGAAVTGRGGQGFGASGGDTARSPPRRLCRVSRRPFLCPESVGGSCRLPCPGQGPLSPDSQGRGCAGSGRGSWGAQPLFLQAGHRVGAVGSRGRTPQTVAVPGHGAALRAQAGSFLLPHLMGRASAVTWASRRP